MDDDGPKFSKLWVEGKSLPNMNISRNEILRWSGWWWTEVFKVRHACSYDFYNAWQSSSSFRFRFSTSSLFQFFDLLCNFSFLFNPNLSVQCSHFCRILLSSPFLHWGWQTWAGCMHAVMNLCVKDLFSDDDGNEHL